MNSVPADLEAVLRRSPEDWSVRIRLVEGRIRAGDPDGARRLVRESPDDSPLPPELQWRLHALMTRGADALAELREEPEATSPALPRQEERDPSPALDSAPAHASGDAGHPAGPSREETAPVPPAPGLEAEAKPPRHHHPLPLDSRLALEAGGELSFSAAASAGASARSPAKGSSAPPFREAIRVDWKAYREREAAKRARAESDLRLETLLLPPRERESHAARKMSALSVALLLHLVLIALAGLVVISLPRPAPPQILASVEKAPERDVISLPPRPVSAADPQPAAASLPPPDLVGAIGVSPVKIPETEPSRSLDVTALVAGTAAEGRGFSFAGEARELSQVNFFGISAGGKRVVFIVDATREMLVDEKGGMFAYDKVKNEIAAMLAGLNRGTRFNILLYEGKRLTSFAEEPVPAFPSQVRLAIEWLSPLNRDYEALGLASHRGETPELEGDLGPVAARDNAHYAKAIQKALEWQAESIFCIASGYRVMPRSPSAEEMEKYLAERARNPGSAGTVPAREREAWIQAQQRTREWLEQENQARAAKDLPPKVVLNFNALVREITGATPPRAEGGAPGAMPPRPEPHAPGDIERMVSAGAQAHYREAGLDPPALHLVVFLGEDERVDDETQSHFQNLTRKNRGKLKLLRGLAALQDVTRGN